MVLTLRLKPSYRLAAVLVAAHAGAAACVLVTDLSAPWRIALAVALAASAIHAVRRAALLATSDAIVALEWMDDGGIAFQTRDGAWHAARPLPTSFVTPALTVLNVRTSERPRVRHVVLMGDSTGEDEYRRLRMRLRWDRSGCA